jgi:hypothetical protein
MGYSAKDEASSGATFTIFSLVFQSLFILAIWIVSGWYTLEINEPRDGVDPRFSRRFSFEQLSSELLSLVMYYYNLQHWYLGFVVGCCCMVHVSSYRTSQQKLEEAGEIKVASLFLSEPPF